MSMSPERAASKIHFRWNAVERRAPEAMSMCTTITSFDRTASSIGVPPHLCNNERLRHLSSQACLLAVVKQGAVAAKVHKHTGQEH